MQYTVHHRRIRPKDTGLFPNRCTLIKDPSLKDSMLFGHSIQREGVISIDIWQVVAAGQNGEVLIKAEEEDVYCVVQRDQIEQITY
jgi:hypothetical protein